MISFLFYMDYLNNPTWCESVLVHVCARMWMLVLCGCARMRMYGYARMRMLLLCGCARMRMLVLCGCARMRMFGCARMRMLVLCGCARMRMHGGESRCDSTSVIDIDVQEQLLTATGIEVD